MELSSFKTMAYWTYVDITTTWLLFTVLFDIIVGSIKSDKCVKTVKKSKGLRIGK